MQGQPAEGKSTFWKCLVWMYWASWGSLPPFSADIDMHGGQGCRVLEISTQGPQYHAEFHTTQFQALQGIMSQYLVEK
jgi:hypothetical protein